MTHSISLTGGRVLGPDGTLDHADVHIADAKIVDAPAADTGVIDCRGLTVLPGIVDIHGDAFERELHPRPGVDVPFQVAMTSVDRQLLSNGITTAFHGLSITWEPGTRGLPIAKHFMDCLDGLRPRLIADHRVQLRWEVFAHHAIDAVETWLGTHPTPAIAFNDHATETIDAIRAGNHARVERWARRVGVSLEDYIAAAEAAAATSDQLDANLRHVASLATRLGSPMLAHDEPDVDARLANRALGMRISEFPLTEETAQNAVSHGEHVVMGGPNILRGGSHKGSMGAEDAIRAGACTILASDYYYPSLLHAAERVVSQGALPLPKAWALVAHHPAQALGLTDRGTIEPGQRADLVVLDTDGPWRIVHVAAAGKVLSFAP